MNWERHARTICLNVFLNILDEVDVDVSFPLHGVEIIVKLGRGDALIILLQHPLAIFYMIQGINVCRVLN